MDHDTTKTTTAKKTTTAEKSGQKGVGKIRLAGRNAHRCSECGAKPGVYRTLNRDLGFAGAVTLSSPGVVSGYHLPQGIYLCAGCVARLNPRMSADYSYEDSRRARHRADSRRQQAEIRRRRQENKKHEQTQEQTQQ